MSDGFFCVTSIGQPLHSSGTTEGGIFEATLRPSDRAMERSSDRLIDRAIERSSDRATERPGERATERSVIERASAGDRKLSSRSPLHTLTSTLFKALK